MPACEIGNDFFDIDPKRLQRGMFAGANLRRHAEQETCSEMLAHATRKLIDHFSLDVETDIDLILTNVGLGDQFFIAAAIPVTLSEATRDGVLFEGARVCLAGFSHAGDYTGALIYQHQAR